MRSASIVIARPALTRAGLILCLFIALLSSGGVRADKTDVVYLMNGDRLTGEVKGLELGMLELKTDHMGTVYIEWEDIEEIVSSTGQAVELTNGQRFFGPLSKPENHDMVLVNTEQGTVSVSTADVVAMYPVESSLWDRLDLYVDLGFSWDKGSAVGKYEVGVDAVYRDPRFISRGSFGTEITTQEGRDDTSRTTFDAQHMRFHPNNRFHALFGNLESNDELGIDLRMLVGAGYGTMPIRTQRSRLSIGAGLAVNHEIPVDGNEETNLEGVGMFTYDYFRYSDPERSLTTNLFLFPSLSELGRWRANFTIDFRLELVSDFFWKLGAYASYDSDPISVDASSSDYGISSSLGYSF
jgi:hypothetical protein